MEKRDAPVSRRPPKFRLKKETVQYLGNRELSVVVGGASAVCCFKCGTSGNTDVCTCPLPP